MSDVSRYNKFSRELSQTPWLIDGERKSESSVEEHICGPLNMFVLASEWRFSSSGREDVDVRMLGTGRPFVVEFINPRRVNFTTEQMKDARVAITVLSCMLYGVSNFQGFCHADPMLSIGDISDRISLSVRLQVTVKH